MSNIVIGIAAIVLLIAGALTGMIIFGTGTAPPAMASISAPFRNVDFGDLPNVKTLSARDGTVLAYRVYAATPVDPSKPERAVIAIHGSSANGASLHPLAKAMQAAGLTVYAPDIRGHGGSGRRGDIDYVDELVDDLADFVAMIRKERPQAKLLLLGFSSGGGFALHAAATPTGASFERAVLISPMLGPRAPTTRPGVSDWAKPFIPRIIALLILEKLHIHAFEHLPTLAFATSPHAKADLTSIYSFALMRAFGTNDYVADVRDARTPLTIVAGEKDQLFDAKMYAPTMNAVRPGIPVFVVPELDHVEMTTDPRAVPFILDALGAKR